MDDDALLDVLDATALAVRTALDGLDDWGLAGTRAGQYRSDLAADEAALAVLGDAGLGVLSEETGLHDADRPLIAVLDPVDGSTNASRGIPWFATSIGVLDADGLRAALVVNQATGVRFRATRGGGAWSGERRLSASGATDLGQSLVGISGYPRRPLGWRQYRALGAAALDLCAVASGALDGYVDCTGSGAHGVWDFAAGVLICHEAGAVTADGFGRDLMHRDPVARRAPVAAATPGLLDALVTNLREAAEK